MAIASGFEFAEVFPEQNIRSRSCANSKARVRPIALVTRQTGGPKELRNEGLNEI